MATNSGAFCRFLTIVLFHISIKGDKELEPLPDAFKILHPLFSSTINVIPEQVHLSLGSDEFSMEVLWSTIEDADDDPSYVYYGLGKNNLTIRVQAEAEGFVYGNPLGCQGMYRAVMRNLTPEALHTYQVETNRHRSKIFEFRHPSNRVDRSSKYLVYGDLGKVGGGSTVHKLVKEVGTQQYDAVLHVGDFAYNFYNDGGRRGDDFMNRIEPIASKVAYMHSPGNHEIMFDFIHYRHKFSSPNTPWPIPKYKMWYSFDVGLVHFVSYSTEVYYTENQAYAGSQYHWLSLDLINANRNRETRPWIIAFGHRPMYCSNINRDDCTNEVSQLRQGDYNLERLFHTQGVDVIIEAHEHSYERLYPLYNGTQTDCGYVNPRSAVHIISGAAGCNEREMICADVFLDKPPHWSAKRSWLPGLNGYGVLTVFNRTHLLWQQNLSLSDEPLDSFYVIQSNHTVRDSQVSENRCPGVKPRA